MGIEEIQKWAKLARSENPEDRAEAQRMSDENLRQLEEWTEENVGSPESGNQGEPDMDSMEDLYKNGTEVNGVEIKMHVDYGDYCMYFPQINLGEEASEKGVPDQVIRISEDPEVAKKVFDYACEVAKRDADVYSLYKKVERFAREVE